MMRTSILAMALVGLVAMTAPAPAQAGFLDRFGEVVDQLQEFPDLDITKAVEAAKRAAEEAAAKAKKAAADAAEEAKKLAAAKAAKEAADRARAAAEAARQAAQNKVKDAENKASSAMSVCNDKKGAASQLCDCGRVCTPWGPCVCANPLYHVCKETVAAASAVLGAVCGAADAAGDAIKAATSVFESAQSAFENAFNKAKNAAQDLLDETNIYNKVKDLADKAEDGVKDAMAKGDSLLDKFLDRISDLKDALKDDLGPVKDLVDRFADKGGDHVKSLGDKLKDLSAKIKRGIESGDDALVDSLKDAFHKAKQEFEEARDAFMSKLEGLGEFDFGDVEDLIKDHVDFDVSKRIKSLRERLADLLEKAKTAAGDAKEAIEDEIVAIKDKIPDIKDEIKDLVDRLAPFDLEDVKDLVEEGKDLVETKDLMALKEKIAMMAKELAEKAKGAAGDALDQAKDALAAAKKQGEMLKEKLRAVLGKIKDAVFDDLDQIPALLERFKESEAGKAVAAAGDKAKVLAMQLKEKLEMGDEAAADLAEKAFDAAKKAFNEARDRFMDMVDKAGELSLDDIMDDLKSAYAKFDISKRLLKLKDYLDGLVEQAKDAAGDAKDALMKEIRIAKDTIAANKWRFQRIAAALSHKLTDEIKELVARFKDSKPAMELEQLMELFRGKAEMLMEKLEGEGSDADPAVLTLLEEIDQGEQEASLLIQQLVVMAAEETTKAMPSTSTEKPMSTATDKPMPSTDKPMEGVLCTDGKLENGNKCSCKAISGCNTCLKMGEDVKCLKCEASRWTVGNRCPGRVECKGGKTADGTECKCTAKCHRCSVNVAGEPSDCEICKRSTYNHEGECLEKCPEGLAHVPRGSSQYGRTCQASLTCLKETIVTKGHAREGKACRCEKNCLHCSYGIHADGPMATCMKCTNKMFFHDGKCIEKCPAGMTGSGIKQSGRFCAAPFKCTKEMMAAGKCQCHKRCSECMWEADNQQRKHVCTACKKANKSPKNGAC